MILFIAAWHLVTLMALFVGWYAAIVSTGIILLLHGVYRQIERENTGWEQAKREKRSAAARKGWETRRDAADETALRESPEFLPAMSRIAEALNETTIDWDKVQKVDSLDGLMQRARQRTHGDEDEVDRVLRQLDQQAKAKQEMEEPHGD